MRTFLAIGLVAVALAVGTPSMAQEFVDGDDEPPTQRHGMHSCPEGNYVVGVHVARNDLLCAPDPLGIGASYTAAQEIVDGDDEPPTQREGMHACPNGMAMTGVRADRNLLACAPALPEGNGYSIVTHLDATMSALGTTATQRAGMHAVQPNEVLVGIHVLKNAFLAGVSGNSMPVVRLEYSVPCVVGASKAALKLTAHAYDEDGAVTSVRFISSDGSGPFPIEDNEAPYEYEWSGIPPGAYTFHAVATDDQGATRESSYVDVHIGAGGLAPPSAYRIDMLPAPMGGEGFTGAHDINEAGVIVGSSRIYPGGSVRPCVWREGSVSLLPSAGEEGEALAINDAGDIAGLLSHYNDARAAIWRSGGLVALDAAPHPSRAIDINNAGEVLVVTDSAWLVWKDGEITDPGLPMGGHFSSYASPTDWSLHLNVSGQVIGTYFVDGTDQPRAFRWTPGPGGGYEDLEFPPHAEYTMGLAIDDLGNSAGIMSGGHLMIWSEQGPRDLGTLGWFFGVAGVPMDLNASGVVVGRYWVGGLQAIGLAGYCDELHDLRTMLVSGSDELWTSLGIPGGVNESGQIVGEGQFQSDSDNLFANRAGFLLTPVWE